MKSPIKKGFVSEQYVNGLKMYNSQIHHITIVIYSQFVP